jgi:hypothetical protein
VGEALVLGTDEINGLDMQFVPMSLSHQTSQWVYRQSNPSLPLVLITDFGIDIANTHVEGSGMFIPYKDCEVGLI